MNVESWGSSHNTVAAAGGSATVQRNATETVTLGSGSGVTVFGDGFDNQDNTGVIAIGSGGTGFNQIANGGYICVEGDGATSVDALVTGNGWQDVAHNGKTGTGSFGFATGTKLTQGGRQYVYSNGTAADTSVGSSGLMMVISGGTALNAAVAGAGNVEIQPGGSLSGGVVEDLGVVKAAGGRLGGHIDVAGYIGGGTIIDQGVVDITSGGVASQIVVASGGSIHIDPGGRISNGVFLQVGGHATVDASVSGTVDLAQDGYARLIVTGRTNPKLVISGFNGARKDASDQIVLRDIPRADIMKVDYPDVDHVAFTLRNGETITLTVPGVKKHGFSLDSAPDGSTIFEVCFLSGTLITTPFGDQPVENLKAGDDVFVFHDGVESIQKIVWTGQKAVIQRKDENRELESYPVRIKAHAFAPGQPFKDLLVTPEHCLFVDGCLVPARMLVNGHSVQHDRTLTTYTYHHIETETHSLLQSDGLFSESYLDRGNRSTFDPGTVFKAASEQLQDHETHPDVAMAAPLNVDAVFVKKIWDRLAQRAGLADISATASQSRNDLHLVTQDGRRLTPSRISGKRHIFCLTGEVSSVRLVSDVHCPSRDIGPWVDDRRSLGVLVGQVSLYSSKSTREIDLSSDEAMGHGWHQVEPGSLRWTSGNAAIFLGSHLKNESRILSIEIAA